MGTSRQTPFGQTDRQHHTYLKTTFELHLKAGSACQSNTGSRNCVVVKLVCFNKDKHAHNKQRLSVISIWILEPHAQPGILHAFGAWVAPTRVWLGSQQEYHIAGSRYGFKEEGCSYPSPRNDDPVIPT